MVHGLDLRKHWFNVKTFGQAIPESNEQMTTFNKENIFIAGEMENSLWNIYNTHRIN
jgi:hypothetical protein